MHPKFIAVIVFIALMMALFGGIAQGVPLQLASSANSTADPNVNIVIQYAEGWQSNGLGQVINVYAHGQFFNALFKLLAGQENLYAIFPQASPWVWIWLILWIPFMAMVVFGIIMLFIGIIQRVFS